MKNIIGELNGNLELQMLSISLIADYKQKGTSLEHPLKVKAEGRKRRSCPAADLEGSEVGPSSGTVIPEDAVLPKNY